MQWDLESPYGFEHNVEQTEKLVAALKYVYTSLYVSRITVSRC